VACLPAKYSDEKAPPSGSRLAVPTPISEMMKRSLLTSDRLAQVAALETFAKDSGHTLLELAISWLTSQPIVGSVITGATSAQQIVANANSACWELSDEDLRQVSQITASPAP
jgi:aryl-alcohol dehydrogenase-like predicted oxidoreductase